MVSSSWKNTKFPGLAKFQTCGSLEEFGPRNMALNNKKSGRKENQWGGQ